MVPVAIEILDGMSCHDSNEEITEYLDEDILSSMFNIPGSGKPCDIIQTVEKRDTEMADIVMANEKDSTNDEIYCQLIAKDERNIEGASEENEILLLNRETLDPTIKVSQFSENANEIFECIEKIENGSHSILCKGKDTLLEKFKIKYTKLPPPPPVCPRCGIKQSSKRNLERHFVSVHNNKMPLTQEQKALISRACSTFKKPILPSVNADY